jgi:hypothetical protein
MAAMIQIFCCCFALEIAMMPAIGAMAVVAIG